MKEKLISTFLFLLFICDSKSQIFFPCKPMCPGNRQTIKTENNPNGCGPGIPITWIANFLVTHDMEECCNAHDICYADCSKSKMVCDMEFRACGRKKSALDSIVAEIMNVLVEVFGCSAYQQAQAEYCRCN